MIIYVEGLSGQVTFLMPIAVLSSNDVDHSFNYFAIHETVQMLDDPQDYEVGEPINYSLRYMSQNTLILNRALQSNGQNGATSSITVMEVAS